MFLSRNLPRSSARQTLPIVYPWAIKNVIKATNIYMRGRPQYSQKIKDVKNGFFVRDSQMRIVRGERDEENWGKGEGQGGRRRRRRWRRVSFLIIVAAGFHRYATPLVRRPIFHSLISSASRLCRLCDSLSRTLELHRLPSTLPRRYYCFIRWNILIEFVPPPHLDVSYEYFGSRDKEKSRRANGRVSENASIVEGSVIIDPYCRIPKFRPIALKNQAMLYWEFSWINWILVWTRANGFLSSDWANFTSTRQRNLVDVCSVRRKIASSISK